jgi:preprotein translocase subunit YajC
VQRLRALLSCFAFFCSLFMRAQPIRLTRCRNHTLCATFVGVDPVITPAYAQAAAAPGGSDILVQMMPFVLIFIIMYFLLIRPQQKRVKAHQEMIKNVRRGDTVVLNSGMIGKVTKVIDDNEAEVEIADNVKVKVVKSMIADVRNKTEPAPAA